MRRTPLIALFSAVHLNSLITEGVVPKALEVRRTPHAPVESSCCRFQF